MRFAAGKKPFPDVGVPSANTRGIDSDQDFTGINCRYRQGVSGDHVRSAKAVDGRGEHRAGHMHRVVRRSNNMGGLLGETRIVRGGARSRVPSVLAAPGNAPPAFPSAPYAMFGACPARAFAED